MKPLLRYWTDSLQDSCAKDTPASPVERRRDRDYATIALLVGYTALGVALLITLIYLGPLMATLGWRPGR